MTIYGKNMSAEISEQPLMFARILENRGGVDLVAEQIRRFNPKFIMFAGRGTSDNAALYGKYLTEIKLNLPTGQISASSLTAFGARPNFKDVLVIVISQSGGSPDLIETATVSKQCGALVLAITNNSDSELVAAADLHLDVQAGPEIAVAATKSFTAQMLTLWLLICALAKIGSSAARDLERAAYSTLDRSSELVEVARKLAYSNNLVVTGRGYSYPVALEAALKIMETSYIHSHGFSSADLVHGPLAMIGPHDPVIVIAPDGKGFQALRPALDRLIETTSNVIIFGGKEAKGISKLEFINPHSCDEELSPLIDIIALQTAIVELAIVRGNDPDNPRGLSKITKTW
jgi:glucosamine--fructose-6-phosphate aminotransferase (isomerizing)